MSDTLWQRLTRGVRRVREQARWGPLAGPRWVDEIMDVPLTDHFHAKQGRSTARWVLQRNGREITVYLKRHYRLSWWRGLMAVVWPWHSWAPGLQEWRRLEWARREGVAAPAAVAAGEFIGPWGKLQSFLAVEELTGMLPLHEAIPLAATSLDAASFRAWKRGLCHEMARLVRILHDRKRFHKDLYLCHFFVRRGDCLRLPDWQGRVHLIDFHRLAHHRGTALWWQVKDLAELLYSAEIDGVDAQDRACFWSAYLGEQQRTRWGWWLRKMVIWKWRLYRRHNRKNHARAA